MNPNLDAFDDDRGDHPTLEALTSGRAQKAEKNAQILHSAADFVSSENASNTVVAEHDRPDNTGTAQLEEEAAGEGAFNPETGEINWDCPCLGGMAHGPCGPEFREAFSCFVYSTEEPKGMDCIDKFQNMQGCFQKYPEIYKGELEDDEELSAGLEEERQELVNEIAERKQQQSESGAQRRLLEEPESAPRPARTPKKAATQGPQQQMQLHSEGDNEAQKSASRAASRLQSQPASPPSPATNATTANQRSNQPSEEAKVKVSDDPTHESIFSLERENITEGQKSVVTSQPKTNAPPSGDQTTIPQPEIVPKAAHDASNSVGVPEPKEEGK